MKGRHLQDRKTFIWTALSGGVYALASVIFLTVVSHVLGDTAAGMYTTASMISMQLITVGKFSVRNFQVSDVNGEFTFPEYFSYRIITCCVMAVSLGLWAWIGNYDGEVIAVIVCFGIYRIGDAVSDVIEAALQRRMMLDIASRCQFLIHVTLIAVFSLALVLRHDLIFASCCLAVATPVIIFLVYMPLRKRMERPRWSMNMRVWKGLFTACFALFLSSFLYSFMNNAPRYAIELFSTEESFVQLAKFSELFMPVFVIDMLAGFSLRTWLAPMAQNAAHGSHREVRRTCVTQMTIIVLLTAAAMVFAYFLGGKVLSWFYGTELTAYRVELVLLMAAGGFVAMQTLYESILTIYRGQKHSIYVNLIVILAGVAVTFVLVHRYGIRGAAVGYLVMTGLRAISFFVLAKIISARKLA